jgi:hypothetical protein
LLEMTATHEPVQSFITNQSTVPFVGLISSPVVSTAFTPGHDSGICGTVSVAQV